MQLALVALVAVSLVLYLAYPDLFVQAVLVAARSVEVGR